MDPIAGSVKQMPKSLQYEIFLTEEDGVGRWEPNKNPLSGEPVRGLEAPKASGVRGLFPRAM
jgi:hypothetical protein